MVLYDASQPFLCHQLLKELGPNHDENKKALFSPEKKILFTEHSVTINIMIHFKDIKLW